MTIVKNWDWVCNHPFVRLGEELRIKLHKASGKQSSRARWQPFEAFLQITNHRGVDVDSLGSVEFDQTVQLFIGALHSARFMAESQHSIYLRCHNFLTALRIVDPRHGVGITLSPRRITEQADEWRRQFECLALDEEKVWLWGGWGAKTKGGKSVSFSLYPVYARLGREFTQGMCDALDTLASRRSCKNQKVLSAFCRYVGQTEE